MNARLIKPVRQALDRFLAGSDPLSETEAKPYRSKLQRSAQYAINVLGPWRRYSPTMPSGYTALGTLTRYQRPMTHRVGALAVDENRHYVQVNDGIITELAQLHVYDALGWCMRGNISRAYLSRELYCLDTCYSLFPNVGYWDGRASGLIWRYCASYFCPVDVHRFFLMAETCDNANHAAFGRGYREGLMMMPLSEAIPSSERSIRRNASQPCHGHALLDEMLWGDQLRQSA